MATVSVVFGGGTMGAGIAQSLLTSDEHSSVHLVEVDDAAASAARERVVAGLRLQYKREEAAEEKVASVSERLTIHGALPGSLDPTLVIEAVPEIASVKADLLARASTSWPGALLATNTSSMSITELASVVEAPERFLGMHFFNPVPRSALIELVVHPRTTPATLDAARDWVRRLGKESIQVKDSPGFATSRLGVAIGLEAIRMVEEGVASPADIDRGMVLGYRYPMGPLELTDIVGLDVRLAIAEHLERELGARFAAPQLLRDKVAAGELGKKSGHGFYEWPKTS